MKKDAKLIEIEIDALEQSVVSQVTEMLQSKVGDDVAVRYASWGSLVFGIKDEAEQGGFKFGQEVQVMYRKYSKKGEREFSMNFGTTGKFSLDEERDSVGRMAFYIKIGKLLSDKILISELKSVLFDYADKLDELQLQ